MSNYQDNLNGLMRIRATTFKSKGMYWPNTATMNAVRGTYGVGQLITEAVEQSEQRRTAEDDVRIAFEIDDLIAAIRSAKPSQVRSAIAKFATERAIGDDMLESMIFDCEHYGGVPITVIGGFRLHCVYGIDRIGRRVMQAPLTGNR